MKKVIPIGIEIDEELGILSLPVEDGRIYKDLKTGELIELDDITLMISEFKPCEMENLYV